ncbi:Ppx/GppA family phosphatase [Halalkalibacter flavus]|uniref:Ppx/GppA family phosphatase n=1 Tax=Halalkalibacter flavus TaxID=3090668 RepID=UPI002FC62A0E
MKENLVALIDLGSNSIRLVVYKMNHQGNFKEVEKVKVPARLINYIDIQEKLADDGLNLIINTLLEFKKIIRAYQISRVIGFATAVIRQSTNKRNILEEINKQTGFSFRVFSEYEEAYYGYVGVVHSMDIKNGITIDTGGGSTEITLFQDQKLVHYYSFPFGAITLDRDFTKGEHLSDKQLARLKYYLTTQFESLSWLNQARYPVIGIGGSARSLARVFQKQRGNKTKMKAYDIQKVFATIASLPTSKRSKIKGLSKKRQDIIIPSVQTILTLMEVVEAPYFVYSEKTIRDGVVYEEVVRKTVKN